MTAALLVVTMMLGQVNLYAEIGKDVVLDGSVSNIIAQHPVGSVAGKKHVYVDIPGNAQTVAYVPKEFECPTAFMIEAKVIELVAGGKRQKSEEKFRVAHLDVEKWQCLPGSIEELLLAYETQKTPQSEQRIVELGRGALPGLVRLSSKPSAVALLGKITGRTSGDWPKWWRARWKKSLEELRAEK